VLAILLCLLGVIVLGAAVGKPLGWVAIGFGVLGLLVTVHRGGPIW
jgi:hypothetical protein